jgi:hypothetical protein
MDKTLNDRIEELFRGVVFVLFSFAASLALLLCNPLRGYTLLIKRERVRSSGQIRPYAFLFFSFVLLFFMPAIMVPHTPRFHALALFGRRLSERGDHSIADTAFRDIDRPRSIWGCGVSFSAKNQHVYRRRRLIREFRRACVRPW